MREMSVAAIRPPEILRSVARRAGIRRSHVAALRMRAERTLFASTRPRRELPGRILCYHSVGTPQWGVNDVSPDRFRRRMEYTLAGGARFVTADCIARGDSEGGDLAITFDDGLLSVLQNAAPMLADLGIPWTMFIVPGWADGRHSFGNGVVMGWGDIEKAAAMGASIGSHSMTHPRFSQISPDAAVYELAESRRVIQSRIGLDTRDFAIPFGQSRDWDRTHTRAAYAAGYDAIFAQSQARRPVGTVGRTFITRFDGDRIFQAALEGRFDTWEEWF